MLILTRKIGQSIVIGDLVKVTVKRVRGKQVDLSIEAPKEVSVQRQEIQDQIDAGIPAPAKKPRLNVVANSGKPS